MIYNQLYIYFSSHDLSCDEKDKHIYDFTIIFRKNIADKGKGSGAAPAPYYAVCVGEFH